MTDTLDWRVTVLGQEKDQSRLNTMLGMLPLSVYRHCLRLRPRNALTHHAMERVYAKEKEVGCGAVAWALESIFEHHFDFERPHHSLPPLHLHWRNSLGDHDIRARDGTSMLESIFCQDPYLDSCVSKKDSGRKA